MYFDTYFLRAYLYIESVSNQIVLLEHHSGFFKELLSTVTSVVYFCKATVCFELCINKIVLCNLVSPLILYLEDSLCYELCFVHSHCYVILYNYTKMYLILLLLCMGFYVVSSLGLSQRVVLGTFLYMSMGEHM